MEITQKIFCTFISCLALLAFLFVFSAYRPLNFVDPIQAGKEIYTKGTSSSGGEIFALMSGIKVPAAVLPCVNCHGADGVGRPEGGVTPSNLHWDILSKDNGGQHNNRRIHPPYTDKYLKRAITMGLDPAGNELLNTMPRYQMSQEDIKHLMSYLKVLGKEKGIGIENNKIKTGFILPSQDTEPSKRKAIQELLEAYFTEINQKGGIYNRIFDLHFSSSISDYQTDQELSSCFAIAAYIGMEEKGALFSGWASKFEIPVVGANSWWPVEESLENKYVFYLYPGIEQQSLALIKFIASKKKPENLNIVLIYDQNDDHKGLANYIEEECRKINPGSFSRISLSDSMDDLQKNIKHFKRTAVNTILYFGTPGTENDFFEIADQEEWYPDFLCLGEFSDIRPSQIPNTFDQRVYLAYPTWLSEFTEEGWKNYQSLKKKYNLSEEFQNLQLITLGSAIIYVEMVRNCGRKLSRDKLIDELEKIYDYKTGLIPPVTYGLNYRVGSQKVYITSFDLLQSVLQLETIIDK